jgi:hypothetical protein
MTNELRDKKLDDIERECIWHLDSMSPKGLNVDDFSTPHNLYNEQPFVSMRKHAVFTTKEPKLLC